MMPRTLFGWVWLCAFVTGCKSDALMEINLPVESKGWTYDAPKVFSVNITDTSSRYNIYINLRHSFHYEWRNMWVNVETMFPDSTYYNKRVNLPMSEPNGEWYGKCLGDNCDLQTPIQQYARFPMPGTYKFTIRQDMRVNPLTGVKSIGMRIEKAAPPAPQK
ncbi:MAG: gliding motility lipoprotein GldH [Chitinophagales bacterium]|nr:gliding motility lipoprotein GldH [Chitinophagales bacterium]MDW8419850.1 gliding motility lipoprotein GldH [Chitinophagales bacterium]